MEIWALVGLWAAVAFFLLVVLVGETAAQLRRREFLRQLEARRIFLNRRYGTAAS